MTLVYQYRNRTNVLSKRFKTNADLVRWRNRINYLLQWSLEI